MNFSKLWHTHYLLHNCVCVIWTKTDSCHLYFEGIFRNLILLKGPSINDVVLKSVIFYPLPPAHLVVLFSFMWFHYKFVFWDTLVKWRSLWTTHQRLFEYDSAQKYPLPRFCMQKHIFKTLHCSSSFIQFLSLITYQLGRHFLKSNLYTYVLRTYQKC